MERIQAIVGHPLWQENFRALQGFEAQRIFCRHTVEHFLDTARIAHIENLEQGLNIPKALIYAAALLHDIGRAAQYRDGTPHEEAGAALAREIMADCGFDEGEISTVCTAIDSHRAKDTLGLTGLAALLNRADKASRLCLFCEAEPRCNWPEEKKNLKISV